MDEKSTNKYGIDYTAFKNLNRFMKEEDAIRTAESICEREHWELDSWHVESALNNLDMDMAYN